MSGQLLFCHFLISNMELETHAIEVNENDKKSIKKIKQERKQQTKTQLRQM